MRILKRVLAYIKYRKVLQKDKARKAENKKQIMLILQSL